MTKSNQFRALGRKTLSFQKRQMFSNICCISLCPFFMVVIAVLLGNLITSLLIKSQNSPQELLFCSNIDSFNPNTNWYYSNLSNPDIKRRYIFDPKDKIERRALNYFSYANLDGLTSNPGAAALSYRHPCVQWFGQDYPMNSIYEKQPNYSAPFSKKDSTYTVEPKFGWFETVMKGLDQSLSQAFSQFQLRPWSLIKIGPNVPKALVGSRPKQDLISVQTGFMTVGPNAFPIANESKGFLDTYDTRYYMDFSSDIKSGNFTLNGFQAVPYYEDSNSIDLDDALATKLNEVIQKISQVDKTVLFKSNRTPLELIDFYNRVNSVLNLMPYGALLIEKFDQIKKEFAFTLQYGSDSRISASSGFPTRGQRLILEQVQLDNAILRFSNFSSNFGTYSITQGIRAFPARSTTKFSFSFGSLIGGILFPFGVSFLLPIFVVTLVKEKEDRILVMMKMNGLKAWAYYLSHYITFFILFLISSAIFLIAGVFSGLELFVKTEKLTLVVLFLCWGLAQNALVFLFASLFNKNRNALVSVFLIVLVSVNVSLATEQLFIGEVYPFAYFVWPPFAF
ncbi:hypothetical protein HDU92_006560 [Lobulomyces angularis]|nr:hypothetical protein HDU92_006560 [Lobulomyces angularis]